MNNSLTSNSSETSGNPQPSPTIPQLLLTGFADEASSEKTLDQQFLVMSALGYEYFSIRFLNLGQGIKNIMALEDAELDLVKQAMSAYEIKVSSIGSPIGKVKLCDIDDGNPSPFRPFADYLSHEVPRVCRIAERLEAKLVRGFSFYHPRGSDLNQHLGQAIDQVGEIARVCQTHGLIFGLEVEANLVGQNGFLLAEMHRQINNPNLVLIFDGGNLVMQGYSTEEIFQQYLAMKPGLGWIHIKDYRQPAAVSDQATAERHVDEDAVSDFVPADRGDSGHLQILKDLAGWMPELDHRMKRLGADGVFADLEPHLKGGGQFGGFSGADGFGIATRAFCRVCDAAGITYRLRELA